MKIIKDESIKVIYISGNGHSGSTLLDIILGSAEGFFSGGELTFITRDSIFNEYCSCGEKMKACPVWSEVVFIWKQKIAIGFDEFKRLNNKFERNKTFGRAYKNSLIPDEDFKTYCLTTQQYFQAIQEVTGKSIIVDSSKSPSRIPVLDKIVDLQVIHLCRDFTGVLNSEKKSSEKDIKAGIEEDFPARRTHKVWIDWILTNLLSELFCIGVKSNRIKYADYVNQPEILELVDSSLKNLSLDAVFTPEHMLAGNVLRLKDQIKLNPKIGFKYDRLTGRQKILGRIMDKLFWLWT